MRLGSLISHLFEKGGPEVAALIHFPFSASSYLSPHFALYFQLMIFDVFWIV